LEKNQKIKNNQSGTERKTNRKEKQEGKELKGKKYERMEEERRKRRTLTRKERRKKERSCLFCLSARSPRFTNADILFYLFYFNLLFYFFYFILFFYIEDIGISTYALFFHPVPVYAYAVL